MPYPTPMIDPRNDHPAARDEAASPPSLNIAALQELIERLRLLYEKASKHEKAPYVGFNMGTWQSDLSPDVSGNECGTTACIAGHTVAMIREEQKLNMPHGASYVDAFPFGAVAKAHLGLTYYQSDKLFVPLCDELTLSPGEKNRFGYAVTSCEGVSLHHAILTLERLVETGTVDWIATFKDARPHNTSAGDTTR